ncbi:MAG: tyrosine-type recombinase/integrase [Xenococcaceae cyanobacterium]
MNLKQFDWSSEDYDGLFEKEVPLQLLQNPLLKKDIWLTKEDLKLETHQHNSLLTLNFSKIQPQWLNVTSKLLVLKQTQQKLSIGHISSHLCTFRKFSKFLKEKKINSIKMIDSSLFEQFYYWNKSTGLKEKTLLSNNSYLYNLFETCNIEGWLEVNTYWFYRKRGRFKCSPDKIIYIPEEVWNQLEENLCHFPEPMQRKVLIIRTLGLRIGELLNLPLNCLRKRSNKWRLRLKETEKFQIKGDEISIPIDLVPVIKEQQDYIKEKFGDSYQNLFCSNNGGRNLTFKPINRVMSAQTFNRWLNQLATQYKICSKDGKIWHFTSHQFRRTVATVMTNAGVRDLIIQKYLRHRNPDMQKHYKHLLKEVIGEEYQELTKEKNFVNIEGKVVATHKPQDAIEEYIRLKMHQITTQQGECHRTNLKKPCPTVNGCWRCGDWMTSEKDLPYLQQDLERLENELEKANNLGMVRVAKEIQRDINYLTRRANILKEIVDNDRD